jgi:hypothetical protein
MTLDELSALTVDVLTPAQVAPILRLDADTIRGQARECPERLGFPVIVAKSRVKIPRVAFLRFMRGECTEGEKTQ